nr:MAG TPA: ATP-dependent Clp protease ATP-binding subunit [Caudoviricetes sp.]
MRFICYFCGTPEAKAEMRGTSNINACVVHRHTSAPTKLKFYYISKEMLK